MEIIPIGGHDYAIGRLNALDQLHVSRKIAPIIPNILPILTEVAKGEFSKTLESLEAGSSEELDGLEPLAKALEPFMEAIAKIPEDDVNYVIHKCLSVVKRNGAVVCRGTSIMFDDLDMSHLLPLTVAVIRTNLGNFIQGLLTKASSIQAQST
ncbi:phage tail assembly chaperone [Acinetobacter thermotolerans]|uniref:phage tail assembly chaperone n=1 Tax=Acinetobacter thermotolerans TaxID=3151487 RepID=UPI00384CA9FA